MLLRARAELALPRVVRSYDSCACGERRCAHTGVLTRCDHYRCVPATCLLSHPRSSWAATCRGCVCAACTQVQWQMSTVNF